MANRQRTESGFLIKCLVAYYVLFNMPATRYYVNTYVSMGLMVLLFLGIWGYGFKYGKSNEMFVVASFLYLFLILVDKLTRTEEFLIVVWDVFLECLPLALGFWLIHNKRNGIIRQTVILIFLTYLIVCITTYTGLLKYPMASRDLAAGHHSGGVSYTKLNIGGFEFIYSMVAAHPLFVCFLRRRRRTLLAVLLTIVFAVCIAESKYATALIGFAVSLATYCIPVQEKKRVKRHTGVVMVVLLVIGLLRAPDILTSLSQMEALSAISEKLVDAARLLQGDKTSMSNTVARMKLYAISFDTFRKYPIFGGMVMGEAVYGGHSWFLDIMAKWGMVGLSVIIMFVVALAKWYRTLFAGSSIYYHVQLSLYLTVFFAAVNPIFFTYVAGFVVPILAYAAKCGTKVMSNPNICKAGVEDESFVAV